VEHGSCEIYFFSWFNINETQVTSSTLLASSTFRAHVVWGSICTSCSIFIALVLCWKICESYFMGRSVHIQNSWSQLKCLNAIHFQWRTGNEIYAQMFIILANIWFLSDFRNYKHREILTSILMYKPNIQLCLLAECCLWLLHNSQNQIHLSQW
jgi:hypothetical protein